MLYNYAALYVPKILRHQHFKLYKQRAATKTDSKENNKQDVAYLGRGFSPTTVKAWDPFYIPYIGLHKE
jgi:hypothetical protein